jgi:hypothetical protein
MGVVRERDSGSRASDRKGRLVDGGYKWTFRWDYDV